MSWRRFIVLLAGLSDMSLVAGLQREGNGAGGGHVPVLSSRQSQQAFLQSLMG